MIRWPSDAASASIAGAFSLLAVAGLLHFRACLPVATPNTRTLHEAPVPRVGGLAIWAGVVPLAAAGALPLPGGAAIWWGCAVLAVASLFDDWRGLSPAIRLAVHVAAASIATGGLLANGLGLQAPLGIAAVLAVLAVAWSANAYNFMDGTDGLAAAMTVTGFAAYAAAATPSAGAYWTIVAATVPFALVNWPPARIFMGDCGAVPLGFLAAAAGIGEWARGTWPGWFPLVVFLPFLADASVTLLRRIARRERVWEAHRSHYYQRWHQLGAGHGGTLAAYGTLMVATALSAVLTLRIEPAAGWIVLGAWCLAFAVLFTRIEYHWRHRTP